MKPAQYFLRKIWFEDDTMDQLIKYGWSG